jgi:oxygen-independent coproporphyrinogen-3 oxidase
MHAITVQLAHLLEHTKLEPGAIETIFIGGGTPSTVAPELYAPFFALLRPYLANDAEVTSEANPNSASSQWLEGMQALGVNRLSFGVQSFDAKKLNWLNRAHTSDDAKKALLRAKELGFQRLSLDLIYGTAMDTKSLLDRDLDQAMALGIDHLSAYALTIEEGTPFSSTPQVAKERLSQTQWLFDTIAHYGLPQYEISNFSKEPSRHNLGYWQYKPYLGIGAGAVGFDGTTRYYPEPIIERYIHNPLAHSTELLSDMARKDEQLFLGLRSVVGVEEALLNDYELQRATLLLEAGKLTHHHHRFYNPDYLLSDELVLFLGMH